MKKLTFKIIALTLALSHLFVICLRDVSFAEESQTASSSSEQAPADTAAAATETQAANTENSPAQETPAQSEPAKSSPATTNIPAIQMTGAAGFNLGALQSFQADPFTGKATFSLPIAVPAGRKGMQPSIALTYSSGSGNSILGIGWSLELGFIERSTKKGAPKYDSSDTFIFNSGGAQAELVNVNGNEYRAKTEGAFMKFTFDGASWVVTDKTGTRYYFGQSSASRIEDGSRILRWALNKVVDINGNYLTLTYSVDQNQIYPSQIQYTGNENTGLAPGYSVEFTFDSRPDISVNYRPGFKIATGRRLTDIRVKYNGELVRRYHLDFSTSNTNHSLLSSVTQYGDDDSTALPPITFTYQSNPTGWNLSSQTLPADAEFLVYTRIFDVNNDGFPDLVTSCAHVRCAGCEIKKTFLGGANLTWQDMGNWQMPAIFGSQPAESWRDDGVQVVDVNGDGWLDIISHMHNDRDGCVNKKSVYLNNKTNGWEYNSTWSEAMPEEIFFIFQHLLVDFEYREHMGWVGADINGDGLSDFIRARGGEKSFYLNTGSGWQRDSTYDMPEGDFSDGSTQLCDLNADGLLDFFIMQDSSSRGYLNTGKGWGRDYNFDINLSGYSRESTQLIDINSDGLADIVIVDSSQKKTFINTGGSGNVWQERSEYSIPEGNIVDYSTRLTDARGKLSTDILFKDSSQNKIYASNSGVLNDLLVKVQNGIGGETQITYKSSVTFDNKGTDNSSDLAFPVYVVDTVTTHDSIASHNPDITGRYEYKGGVFDFKDREFRGFNFVKAIDSEGNYSETYFHQDDIYKSRPYLQQAFDTSGNLYTKTENTWAYTQPYSNSSAYFPYLAKTDSYAYEGGANYKHTQVEFEYDSYGNPTKVISQGDVEVSGDEKSQLTEYTYNTDKWIIATPKATFLQDASGNTVAKKLFYYDYSSSFDTVPDKGLLTKEESWGYNPLTRTADIISTTYTYDDYGNLAEVTDALLHSTATEYDNTLFTYPVKVTNAKGQIVQSTYDYKTGQALTTTDPNNQTGRNIYDTLGRLIAVIGPNDTEEYPQAIYAYDLSQRPLRATSQVKVNYTTPSDYLTVYQFYDGLGRILQTKSPALPDPQTRYFRQIISDIAVYNSRGQVEKKYLPIYGSYFLSFDLERYNPVDYANAIHSTFSYDALGRLTQATNPDSTYSSVSYSLWQRTVTDENTHYKTEYSDAYGRITKIEEHNQGQTYTTQYEYDTQGNLTKTIDDKGNTTQIWYDTLGRKIKMDDPDMGVWAYEYDAAGNLKKQTDAKKQVLEFNYDEINRLKQKLANGQALATYTYDATAKPYCIGRLSQVTDKSGSSEFFYDNLGREIKSTKTVTASGSFTVERTYDALSRLLTLKYPDGEIVTYTYNPQGIEKVGGASPYITNIEYTATGQIIKIQYGNGAVTNYAYDPKTLRLTNLTTDSSSGRIQELNYQFDNIGNIKNINDSVNTATQSFVYDDLDRLTQANGSYGAFSYEYDSIGNMLNKEGTALTYGKNGKLPHAVTQYGSTAIDYDSNGNTIKKGGLTYSYDAENRLAKVAAASDATTEPITLNIALTPGWNFISFPITFDNTGIAAVLSSIAGKYAQVSRYNASTKQFEHYVGNSKYDQFSNFEYGRGYEIYITATGSITLAVSGKLPTSAQTLQLTQGYNLIFNPKADETSVEIALSGLTLEQDYSKILYYNPFLGQYQEYSAAKQEFTSFQPSQAYYLYCTKNLTWNVSNSGLETTTFTYDGDGGRVKKATASGSTTYIGSLYEKDSDGKATKHIFSGANRICSKGLSPQGTVPEVHYFHSDHLGSSNVITDEDGQQAGLTEFTPYGSTFKHTGTYDPKYKFTGKELDASTGMYFYGARYYDPQLGRFITADSIVQSPYDPQSLNRYSYCRNNPLNLVDPSGNWSWKKFWHSFAGAFLGVALAFVLGPAGFGMSMAMAGMWGGMAGGALTGGLEGGWKGALIGGAIGGILGGIGGWAVAGKHYGVLGGMFAAGTGVAGATNSWDSYAGAFVGGIAGAAVGGGINRSLQSNRSKWGYGGFSSSKLMADETASSTSVYGQKRGWVGYGYGSDTKGWVQSNFPNEYNFFSKSSNIDFVENPSWGQFTKAMTSGYKAVGLDIHGSPGGLAFSDGIHSLSELSGIANQINAGDFGLVACYPKVQANAWTSLNISTTNFIDLSTVSVSNPNSTSTRQGIIDLKYFIDSRINN